MKVFTSLFACLTVVTAQRVLVGYPSDNAKLTAGQSTPVQIVLPNFLSSSSEVAVVIGIQSCVSSPCSAPADTLGRVLYNGGFKPQRDPSNPTKQPYQNFTVSLPSNLPKGKAQLNVAHFALIGAGLMPWMETLNTTIIIQ